MMERRRCGSRRDDVGQAGGVEVHLIKTGIGPSAAAAAAQAVLSEMVLDAVVSTGYAGALGAAGIGDVILGTEILKWTTDHAQTCFSSDPALLANARQAADLARVPWLTGAVVTVENVIWRAEEKQALGKASGAVAVDMESAAIAQAAAAVGVPFILVRAVSDRAEENLPMDFNLWLTGGGRLRAFAQLVRHPSILRALFQMKRQVEQGSQNLACFFHAWWHLLGQEQSPARLHVPAVMGVRSW